MKVPIIDELGGLQMIYEHPLYKELLNYKDWQIDIRRDFHMYPELSEVEYRTQEKIIEYLNEMNMNHFPCAETGVCGVLLKNGSNRTIALRADIDALPLIELLDSDFRSKQPGVMHACGHDAHMAIQLLVAKYFSDHPEELKCHLKFIFQPAEETVGGAERLIHEGIMETPQVDYILGLHVMPYLPIGTIEYKYGKLNAASDTFKWTIRGKSAHGAYPDQGVDAIVVASEIVNQVQTIISREISPLTPAVLTIGTFNGGSKSNIICDEVIMTGGIRTTDEVTRKTLKKRITEVVQGVAALHGAEGNVEFETGYKALINHDEVVSVIKQVALETLGEDHVVEKELPSMGVEDFSYYLDYAKGAFFHLGCGISENGLHSSDFILDESCLLIGSFIQIEVIKRLAELLDK